jgi:hypothetical protein
VDDNGTVIGVYRNPMRPNHGRFCVFGELDFRFYKFFEGHFILGPLDDSAGESLPEKRTEFSNCRHFE